MNEADYQIFEKLILEKLPKVRLKRWLKARRGNKTLLRSQRNFRRYRRFTLIRVIMNEASRNKSMIDGIRKLEQKANLKPANELIKK